MWTGPSAIDRTEAAHTSASGITRHHCGESISQLPPTAKFCPHCGGSLAALSVLPQRSFCSWIIPLREFQRFLRGLLPHPAEEYSGDPDRTKVVIGYGNALFNLGWRYERGLGARRNLPEAVRCYSKSSKLGNADATVRLPPVQEAVLTEGDTPDAPLPVMPIWRSWETIEDEKREREERLARAAYEWTRVG